MKFLHIFLLIPLIQSINLFQLAENLQPQPHTSNFDDQIQFLPRFHQVQTQNSQLKLLTKFLIDDDEILKDNNGIYDETGRDGIDPSEENFPFDSEENINQRVRSSSMLWIKQNSKFAKYEAYGSSENDEKLNGWTIKTVLLMNGHGDHILKKVCLSQKEKLISFVLDMDEMCKEKIHIAEEFEEKENNFFPKTKKGFAGKICLILKIF